MPTLPRANHQNAGIPTQGVLVAHETLEHLQRRLGHSSASLTSSIIKTIPSIASRHLRKQCWWNPGLRRAPALLLTLTAGPASGVSSRICRSIGGTSAGSTSRSPWGRKNVND